jgi:hypothetical protein
LGGVILADRIGKLDVSIEFLRLRGEEVSLVGFQIGIDRIALKLLRRNVAVADKAFLANTVVVAGLAF